MVTIGVDPHKQTHTAAAVDQLGVRGRAPDRACQAGGERAAVGMGPRPGGERVWAVEDVRNVSGSLERFLIDRGEVVVRGAAVDGRRASWRPHARQV